MSAVRTTARTTASKAGGGVPGEPYQDFDLISGELFRLTRLMERSQARHAARHPDGVERAGHLLLVYLVKHGPRRLGALAEAVHSDISTVSRQVAALVKLGLVERRADPGDGRASLLAATEKGERTFQDRRRQRNERFAEMLADWSPADRRQLYRLVSRFNDDFEGYFLGPAAAEFFRRKYEGTST